MVRTPKARIISYLWASTVRVEMFKMAAISLVMWPSAINAGPGVFDP
jgi:hypothetical protein